MRRFAVWLAVGACAVALAIGYRFAASTRTPETAVDPASVFELALTDLNGQPQKLEQWRGKVLVVNYWATWCQPCREEMPGFSRLQEKYRSNGVQFVGISIDTVEKIMEFQKVTPVSYPLLIGDMGVMENSSMLGNTRQALPFTAVFDRQGKLFSTKLGRVVETELDRQLVELTSR